MSKSALRRLLLASCVAGSIAQLLACGVTPWQRDQDALRAAFADLQSPEMERRIAEARGMKVAR